MPSDRAAYPADLANAEQILLARARHRQIRLPENRDAGPIFEPKVGVALSGGGIRSATFALGVFQALARRRKIRDIDYLSTVSGGGYFGAFLGRLFTRSYIRGVEDVEWILGGPEPENAVEVPSELASAQKRVLRWLRDNGRYLSPRGAGDLLLAGAALLRNWLSIHVLLGLAGLAVFLAMQMPRVVFDPMNLAAISPALPARTAASGLLIHTWLTALPWSESMVWWSPWVFAPLVVLACIFPLVWAYWLTSTDKKRWLPVGVAIALALVALAIWGTGCNCTTWNTLVATCAAAATAILATVVAFVTKRRFPNDPAKVRNALSDYLKSVLVVAVVLAALGVIDSLGQTIYAATRSGQLSKWVTVIGTALAGLGAVARYIVTAFGPKADGKRLRLPFGVLAFVGGGLLVVVFVTGYDILAHAVVWQFDPARAPAAFLAGPLPPPLEGVERLGLCVYFASIGGVGLLAWGFGRSLTFVNESSQQPLYRARLTRAYLGASNPARWSAGASTTPVIDPLPGDDLEMEEYWRAPDLHVKGAPLHIVNVTINETIDGESQLQQQDRKGLGLAVGPAGLSAGVRHHWLFDRPAGDGDQSQARFHVFEYAPASPRFPGEKLSLGQWTGISGAAFSTGMGLRTSLGLSLITGLMNVRLGHWWDSKIDMKKREPFAAHVRPMTRLAGKLAERLILAQKFLVSEIVARFPGVARRYWYLSDGGHFENMGAYELIRRKLPVIIVVDGEQDENYTFEGLANLVRKARIDFDTEITFPTDQDEAVGSTVSGLPLSRLRPCSASVLAKSPNETGENEKCPRCCPDTLKLSDEHFAIATIEYGDGSAGTLVYLKATLTGDESADVIEYARRYPSFPQQSTVDQFFDEAQWESYRQLGEHIGGVVVDHFLDSGLAGWVKLPRAETPPGLAPESAMPEGQFVEEGVSL
jgi:hypothetical protein